MTFHVLTLKAAIHVILTTYLMMCVTNHSNEGDYKRTLY